MGELKTLLKQLNDPQKSKLSNKLKKIRWYQQSVWSVKSFLVLFWLRNSGVIIKKFCFDINQDFEEYVSKFKKYCNRRVCEVPDGSFSTKLSESEEKKKLHIQIHKTFINELEKPLEMVDLKYLIGTLKKILNTDLRILKLGDSVVLTFHCLYELDVLFPLSSKQEEELQKIGVVRIYSEEQEYYPQSLPCATKNGT